MAVRAPVPASVPRNEFGSNACVAFEEFVRSVDQLRERETHARRLADGVAQRLRVLLQRPDWLKPEHRLPGDLTYRQHLLHVAQDGGYSVVSLVWTPGQRTPIHDHVSWCVVGVYEGVETERRYHLYEHGQTRFLVPATSRIAQAGDTAALVPPAENIHQVANEGSQVAISIHVYGANIRELGTSIYERFDDLDRRADPGTARRALWRPAA